MRSLLTSAFLLLSVACFAQRQNVYFFKDDGRQVDVKDSADYIRIVREPDSGSVLYNVMEYYANGKQKRIGRSKTIEYPTFDGTCLTFYKNGKRKTTEAYVDGIQSGSFDEYFPNGKLYVRKEIIVKDTMSTSTSNPRPYKKSTEKILEVYDSLGTVKVKDGSGVYTIYNKEFTEVTEEGPVVNGSKNGTWKGIDKKYNATFKEEYKDGELISGKAVRDNLNTVYKVRFVTPVFPGGENGLGRFLARTIRYPAPDREVRRQGSVILTFIIDEDLKIEAIKTLRAPSAGLAAEATRALKLSPNWVPGMAYGAPAETDYSMPINFQLATE